MKKDKTQYEEKPSTKIIWACLYLLLTFFILIATCFIFKKTYYVSFYVRGISMCPTLNAIQEPKRSDYGYTDQSPMALQHIERFDIVTTYYPGDLDEETLKPNRYIMPKIKRVIGLPNEKVTLAINENSETKKQFNEIYINDVKIDTLPFTPNDPNGLTKKLLETGLVEDNKISWTLGEDEYFLMGDNWGKSNDSISKGPVKKDYITGILIVIVGYCYVTGGGENAKIEKKVDYPTKRYFK